MSYRFMRIIVLFDLPVETLDQQREYRRFRKHLIKQGFLMLQQSVYTKIALNQTVMKSITERVIKEKPKYGLVQMLQVTEKQFNSIKYVVGEKTSTTLDSDEKVVIV